MSSKKTMRLRYFEQAKGQAHVTGQDLYLYKKQTPRYRIAVIGAGTIGQEHIRVISLLGQAKVHGVYDSAPHSVRVALENAKEHTQDPIVTYDSLEQACEDSDVDAFVICTPNHTHLAVLKPVLKTNKPVLLEKPMAPTLSEAAEIVRLAGESKGFVQVGLQYRFKATFDEAFQQVQSAKVGKPVTLNIVEHRPPFLDKVDQWNKFASHSGGTLVEKCCHYFDLFNMFAGARPTRVFASGGQAVNFVDFERDGKTSDVLDHASVLIEYSNGVHANLSLNMFTPVFQEELTIVGDSGRLQTRETWDFLNERQSESSISLEKPEPFASKFTQLSYPKMVERSGHHGGTFFEHIAFIERMDGKNNRAATVEQGFWSVLVGAAAEQSVKTGQPVDISVLLEETASTDVASNNVGYW